MPEALVNPKKRQDKAVWLIILKVRQYTYCNTLSDSSKQYQRELASNSYQLFQSNNSLFVVT